MNTVCHATYCLMRLSYFVSWQCSLCGVDIGLSENEGSIKADIELVERIPIKLVAVFTSLYSFVMSTSRNVDRWTATLMQLSAVPVQDE